MLEGRKVSMDSLSCLIRQPYSQEPRQQHKQCDGKPLASSHPRRNGLLPSFPKRLVDATQDGSRYKGDLPTSAAVLNIAQLITCFPTIWLTVSQTRIELSSHVWTVNLSNSVKALLKLPSHS